MKNNIMSKVNSYIAILILNVILINLPVSSKNKSEVAEEIQVDISTVYQEIDGFGACIIGFKEYPGEYYDPDFYDRVVNDLGMSIVRIPLNEQLEWKNDDDDPSHFNWDNFYLENIHRRPGLNQNVGIILKNFKEAGVERFMGTPWSAPVFMKTNRAPIQGGYLRADMVEELAEYLAATVILAKKNYDIDLNWVSVNNESIFVTFYRSCLYNPQMMREAVRATNRKFKELGIKSRILINEDMMFNERIHYGLNPTMSDPETRNFQGHFAVHAKDGVKGLKKWKEISADWNRKLWMTETSGHEATFEGAFAMAETMHNYLVYGNISAWLYWQISEGAGKQDKGNRYSLMKEGKPTVKYYAAKHYYKYIRPGANRVKVDSNNKDLLVSAYKHNLNGRLTIVIINKGEQLVTTSIGVNGIGSKGYVQFRTSASENFKHLGNLNNLSSIEFPSKSITTITTDDVSLKNALPVIVEGVWDAPDATERETLGNPDELPFKREWQLDLEASRGLLETAKKEGVESSRVNGWTLLHDAILHGDAKTVRYLIENGADINAAATDGWTPLHAAAASFVGNENRNDTGKIYSKYDIFKLVLNENPKINTKTSDGWTPLHSAVCNAHTAFRKKENHAIKKITDLAEHGAEVNAKDNEGRTSLHWAAWQGYSHFIDEKLQVESDVVETLIKLGADINAIDQKGNSPLHYASLMGYDEIVYALVNSGAAKYIKNIDGKKPIDLAQENELINTVYILKNEKYPDALYAKLKSKQSKSTEGILGKELFEASWAGDIDEVERLINAGADLYYRDSDGLEAIDRANANGHDKIVKLLIEAKKLNQISNQQK